MDLQGVIHRVTKLDGRVKELTEDKKPLVILVAVVCEAFCEVQPSLRKTHSPSLASVVVLG